jgi:hypothetical protein
MIKRIHVNQHHIKWNKKHGSQEKPVFTVKTYKANHKGWKVTIDGPSTVEYWPYNPLSCGAVAWIETKAPVYVDGKEIG